MILKNKEVTIDEAIDIMKKTRVKVASGNVKTYEKAKAVLISAASYRVEMKPNRENSYADSYDSGTCPTCGKMVDEIEDTYFCHECGQKLSWD